MIKEKNSYKLRIGENFFILVELIFKYLKLMSYLTVKI